MQSNEAVINGNLARRPGRFSSWQLFSVIASSHRGPATFVSAQSRPICRRGIFFLKKSLKIKVHGNTFPSPRWRYESEKTPIWFPWKCYRESPRAIPEDAYKGTTQRLRYITDTLFAKVEFFFFLGTYLFVRSKFFFAIKVENNFFWINVIARVIITADFFFPR